MIYSAGSSGYPEAIIVAGGEFMASKYAAVHSAKLAELSTLSVACSYVRDKISIFCQENHRGPSARFI